MRLGQRLSGGVGSVLKRTSLELDERRRRSSASAAARRR